MTPDMAYETPPAPMSEAGRLSGVIFEPGKAFADIAARPRFYVPLALIILVALGFTTALQKRVGWETAMRTVLERSPRMQQLPEDQREKMIQQQGKVMAVVGYPMAVVMPVVMTLVVSAVYLFLFRTILSVAMSFRQMVAIYCYASIPAVISSLLAILVMFLKPPEDFDVQNPTMFNVGAFLPASTPAWLTAVGTSLDVFVIWLLLLIVVGVRALAPRLSTGSAMAGVFGPWLVLVVVKTCWAALFG